MATQTAPAKEAVVEPIRELNDQVAELGKKATLQSLDAYESSMNSLADYHDKVAETAQVEWIVTASRAQAKLTREITKAYTTTTRELLK
jgi:D-tyrosyl-tRNA(Tyr) deacylase